MNQKIMLGLIIALLGLSMISHVSAEPTGPATASETDEMRWATYGSWNTTAIAGNVTEVIFTGSSVTRTYQGYVGNITGEIVLGDSNNNTLYDWTLANPQGEIYAVRSSTVPTWSSVRCANQTEIQAEDTRLNVNLTNDEDAVNRTFVVGGAPDQISRFGSTELYHPSFYTANQSIANSSCAVAVMYNSSAMPSPYFKNVLLSDTVNVNPVTGFVIYTGIISHSISLGTDADGFNGRTYDFEMIVGEDGHGAQDGPTATTSTYWFYLELE
jgi:hypothetical protein